MIVFILGQVLAAKLFSFQALQLPICSVLFRFSAAFEIRAVFKKSRDQGFFKARTRSLGSPASKENMITLTPQARSGEVLYLNQNNKTKTLQKCSGIINLLIDGLTYNTRGYFASFGFSFQGKSFLNAPGIICRSVYGACE